MGKFNLATYLFPTITIPPHCTASLPAYPLSAKAEQANAILHILNCFYDLQLSSGQDIRTLTLSSLCRAIGSHPKTQCSSTPASGITSLMASFPPLPLMKTPLFQAPKLLRCMIVS